MNFFKTFFASCLGALVAFIILIVLGIGILTAMVSAVESGSEYSVADKSVLQLKITAPIAELELDEPLSDLIPGAGESNTGLINLKSVIAHAKEDGAIQGIYLNISSLSAGISSVGEIRDALLDFRTSG